ncbi:MAG: hypothetical protein WD939_00395 [Dehalococcoidia bacterium]
MIVRHPRSSSGPGASIGLLNEGHLHAALKERYAKPGDKVEADVDGYVVDILRGDLIIEIQTANFAGIARKVRDLVSRHRLLLVYPAPRDLWIVKLSQHEGDIAVRRKSPKHQDVIDVFGELVSFPELIMHKNFQLDVVLTQEEELRSFDKRRRWRRRGWATVERRLVDVIETVSLRDAADYTALVPAHLPERFRASDIATAIGRPRRLAQQVAYCLRKSGLIEQAGNEQNAIVYSRVAR